MILFATHQTAGAGYLLPLLSEKSFFGKFEWKILASGFSRKVFLQAGIDFIDSCGWTRSHIMQWIMHNRPQIILASTSVDVDFEHEIVEVGRSQGIKTVQFIDHWSNLGRRFSSAKASKILPDHILAIDDRTKRDLVEEGIPAERVHPIGQPEWESFVLENGSGKQDGHVLLLLQPISKYYGASLGYDENSFLDVAINALEHSSYRSNRIVVSIHPENEEKHLQFPRRSDIRFSRGVTRSLIAGSCLVMGMWSTVLMHSALMGVSTISVQPDEKEGFFRETFKQLIPTVKDAAELSNVLETKVLSSELIELRRWLRGSLNRLVVFILGSL